jgi:thiamine biosynthesis lipoprotein
MAEPVTRCRPLLGTFIEVTGDSEGAIDAAFDAVAHVHRLMSAHEPDSDISRINHFGHQRAVEVDAPTLAVLERALFWSKASEGAFDIIAAGAAAIERGYVPLHPGQPRPQARLWTCLELCGRTARLLKPACIDVGGIAKGYAVDRAIAAMKAAGAALGLVNAGGDMAGFGPQSWPVLVVRPETRLAIANIAISNGAIATSSVQPDGTDPHLFKRSADLLSATVCAPAAIDADALTKIMLSGSPSAAACLTQVDARAIVMTRDGSVRAVEPERQAA